MDRSLCGCLAGHYNAIGTECAKQSQFHYRFLTQYDDNIYFQCDTAWARNRSFKPDHFESEAETHVYKFASTDFRQNDWTTKRRSGRQTNVNVDSSNSTFA
ncbi:hypothetical protein DPMN_075760 [Dreissena polymorpha]|uniref:Uncharacterized protein n=1 Tax=Dreissena polymorpha TaxID=45954 RepID=A0A9D3YLQ7_DREPO|nr:hypothetical protein DPMN_075760 [Dreissena polymorpha]